MKLQECRDALKTIPPGDPRRSKILEEMERIKKWMESKGYGKSGSSGGSDKKKCRNCERVTYPLPPNPEKCSGCGNFYNET